MSTAREARVRPLTPKRHYSGNHSKRFWDRVNKLPRNEGGDTAYMLGVVLQELEERVLKYLEQSEARR